MAVLGQHRDRHGHQAGINRHREGWRVGRGRLRLGHIGRRFFRFLGDGNGPDIARRATCFARSFWLFLLLRWGLLLLLCRGALGQQLGADQGCEHQQGQRCRYQLKSLHGNVKLLEHDGELC